MFFIVEPDRPQLAALDEKLRDRVLKPTVGAVFPLTDAPKAFDPSQRSTGKTVVRVVDD